MTGKWAGANDVASSSSWELAALSAGVLEREAQCRTLWRRSVLVVSELLNDTTKDGQSSMPEQSDCYYYYGH